MTIEEILKAFEKCDFYQLTAHNFEDKILAHLPDDLDCKWDNGVSKVVFIFPGCDFVIKIPFMGESEEQEEYDEDYDEYYGTGEYIFYPFEGADDLESGDDYCLVEELRYNKALEADNGVGEIAQLFAHTQFVDFVNGYPIYRQPLCSIFADVKRYKIYSHEKTSSTNDACEQIDCHCFNAEWLSDVIDYYGQDIFQKFMNFLREEDITDLHSANIGYIGDRPVLVDYSSFDA